MVGEKDKKKSVTEREGKEKRERERKTINMLNGKER